jgi:hypothetical protein
MKYFVFITALFVAFQSKAEWILVDKIDFGAGAVSFHVKHPVISDGNTRRYWMLSDSPVRDVLHGGFSRVIFYESDCPSMRTRILQTIDYAGPMASGNQVNINPKAQSWTYAAPNSFWERLLLVICRNN